MVDGTAVWSSIAAAAILVSPEPLPVDEMMESYEAIMPRLKEIAADAEKDIGRLGPVEPNWQTSGLSAAAALLAAGGKPGEQVLAEWEKGGHGIAIIGNRPLAMPANMKRYSVREFVGPIDYHDYHRLSGAVVIHTYGTATAMGNAECKKNAGIEIISSDPWQNWSAETALIVAGTAKATRDDPRTYCILYRAIAGGKFVQVAYAPDGRPYLGPTEDPQAFVLTNREEAATRIFAD